MFGSFGAALYRPLCKTSSRHGPWQIAAGISLGIVCGVLLNQSILGLLALAALFFLPIHFPLAIAVALLCAGMAPLFEPIFGTIGVWALGQSWIRNAVGQLHGVPLMPWLRLNNTIVMGALVVGLVQLIPVFYVVRRVFVSIAEYYAGESFSDTSRSTREVTPHVASYEVEQPVSEYRSFDEAEQEFESDEAQSDRIAAVHVDEKTVPIDNDDTIPHDIWEPARIQNSVFHADEESFAAKWAQQLSNSPKKIDKLDVPTADAEELGEASDDEIDWQAVGEELHHLTDPEAMKQQVIGEGELDEEVDESKNEKIASIQTALTQSRDGDLSNATADEVASRAAELAELVDEMLTAMQDEDVKAALKGPAAPVAADSTKIRRDYSQSPLNSMLDGSRRMPNETRENAKNPSQDAVDAPLLKAHTAHSGSRDDETTATTSEPVTLQEVSQHEEALRYLLNHLKEIKDRV